MINTEFLGHKKTSNDFEKKITWEDWMKKADVFHPTLPFPNHQKWQEKKVLNK